MIHHLQRRNETEEIWGCRHIVEANHGNYRICTCTCTTIISTIIVDVIIITRGDVLLFLLYLSLL